MWQGLRLLQEQDINTGKHQTYCYEEHGSYTPLAVIVKQSSGYHYYWHHCDINSAPLDVTNEQGNTVWSGKYERFGFVRCSPLSFYSDPDRKMESFEQNLRYAGQYFDNETGLHFNTFRFYDPQIGRFIMPDPIGLLGGMNLYAYAPNPLGWIDPWGLSVVRDNYNTAKTLSEPEVLKQLQSKYPSAQYEILEQPRVYINGEVGPTGKALYSNPDFMVIDRNSGNIIDLVDAKNGNAPFTANQKLLNEKGGTFKGSSRSAVLPRGSQAKQIKPNSLRQIRTSC